MKKGQGLPAPSDIGRETAATALATGGLLGAIGVASCCALPVALGALGIGSTALFALAALVGPYQLPVLAAAVLCLLGAGLMLWRRRRAPACAGASCGPNPAVTWIVSAVIVLALALLALTFWIEPPL